MKSDDPAVQMLLDRVAIQEVMACYCRAIDRADRELLESTYWPDAIDDHNIFVGPAPAYIDYILEWRARHEQTQHVVTNMSIRIDGDDARSETYLIAYHRYRQDGTAIDFMVGARYLDRLQRRHGEWRYSDRKGMVEWWKKSPSEDYSIDFEGVKARIGTVKPFDPIYELFGPEGR